MPAHSPPDRGTVRTPDTPQEIRRPQRIPFQISSLRSAILCSVKRQWLARIVNALRTQWESVKEPRLAKLWADVQKDLRREWTLTELAHHSHFSPEYLRRLCMRELGRSPIQHLTCLHMGLAR